MHHNTEYIVLTGIKNPPNKFLTKLPSHNFIHLAQIKSALSCILLIVRMTFMNCPSLRARCIVCFDCTQLGDINMWFSVRDTLSLHLTLHLSPVSCSAELFVNISHRNRTRRYRYKAKLHAYVFQQTLILNLAFTIAFE